VANIILFILFIIVTPLRAEVTHLGEDQLVFAKGGGFENTGGRIQTLNEKGIKIDGNFYVRSAEAASTLYTVDDTIVLPNPNGDNTTNQIMVGDFHESYIRMNHNTIEAVVSVDSVVSLTELYLQDETGPLWIGPGTGDGTDSTKSSVSVVAIASGSDIIKRVGIGTTAPLVALHVAGDLFLDGTSIKGEIGTFTEMVDYSGSISRALAGDQWEVANYTPFTIENVNHGVMILGNLIMRNHSVIYPSGSSFRVGEARLVVRNSAGVVVQMSNVARYKNEYHSNAHATYTVMIGAEFAPDTYSIEMQSRNLQFIGGDGTTGTDGNFTTNGLGYLEVIALPIAEIGSSLASPVIEPIVNSDFSLASTVSNAGNYLTKDMVAFESGGRMVARPDNLFSVDVSGNYYPFYAPVIEAEEMWDKTELRYNKNNRSAYDFVIEDGSGSSNKLQFGVNWNGEADVELTSYAERNIQILPTTRSLVFKSPVIMLEDGLTVKDYVTMNKPFPSTPESDIVLDVEGDVIVTGEISGSMIYSEHAKMSIATLAGSRQVYSHSFTLPGDSSFEYETYMFYTHSANFENFDSPHIHLLAYKMKADGNFIKPGVPPALTGGGLSWFGFETNNSNQNDGASFMGFGNDTLTGGTHTLSLHVESTRIHDGTGEFNAKDITYFGGVGEVVILAIPKG
jgi:hypothetical protein